MARMIQDWTDGELKEKIPNTHEGYDGERKLYVELRKLPANWVVIYDKTLSDGKGTNQIDFLVFVPGKGVVNVDAKGGPSDPEKGYHVKNGDIYLGDQRKDVFGQARGAINRFSERVYQLLGIPRKIRNGVEWESNPWGAFGALVVFTNKDLLIPQEHQSSYLGATELYTPGVLEKRINEQLDQHQEAFAAFSRHMKHILNYWTFDDDGRYVSREFAESDEMSARGLSAPQMELMCKAENAEATGRILHVMGAAGTGKTVIACGMARDFTKLGKKVLYVCYNSFLAMQIRSDKKNSFKVLNFHAIGELIGENLTVWNAVEENGRRKMALDRRATFKKIQDAFFGDFKIPKFDVLIVDEAQDLNQEGGANEIAVLLPCLKRSRQIIIFSDKGQSLYSTDWSLDIEAIGGKEARVLEKTLYTNFRNRRKVFDHFRAFNMTENDDELMCYQREPAFAPGVVEVVDKKPEELLQELLLSGKVNYARDVVILGTKWKDIPEDQCLLIGPRRINIKQNRKLDGARNDQVVQDWIGKGTAGNFVLATTEKQFKGLEANVVIFIPGEAASDNQIYVAESRAKYMLYVIDNTRAG